MRVGLTGVLLASMIVVSGSAQAAGQHSARGHARAETAERPYRCPRGWIPYVDRGPDHIVCLAPGRSWQVITRDPATGRTEQRMCGVWGGFVAC